MGFIHGEERGQQTLFPLALDDLIPADHMCRVIEALLPSSANSKAPAVAGALLPTRNYFTTLANTTTRVNSTSDSTNARPRIMET